MKPFRTTVGLALLAAVGLGTTAFQHRAQEGIAGWVRLADGTPAAGALVTLRPAEGNVSHTVIAGADGRFRMPLPPGRYTAAAGYGGPTGVATDLVVDDNGTNVELVAAAPSAVLEHVPASSVLALLPDGEEKRRFIRDCTGCHVFDARWAYPEGATRTAAAWAEAVNRMLGFAGPSSGFPVIAAGREPLATASFLTAHFTANATVRPGPRASADAAGAVITEYAIPVTQDLPHDVAVLTDGTVLITGMFTHRMYLLDPGTGTLETEAIPVHNSNPRAVEIGADGAWWVVLGNPQTIGRRDPVSARWQMWRVDTYPHSLGVAPDGKVWYNGHFSRNPEILGFVDPAADRVVPLEVPAHPEASVGAGPIPYELRVAADGTVWGSELVGDRIFAYDPRTSEFRTWRMPERHTGPRRLDIGPDGMVWIPEYSGGQLTRLDPRTGRFTRFELPVADAAPYIARVDRRTGRVWLGTGAADAVFAFDPATERWTTYPLPSRATLVRHLVIDPSTGDVWLAYGASPGPPAKVARLRPDG